MIRYMSIGLLLVLNIGIGTALYFGLEEAEIFNNILEEIFRVCA